MKVLGLFLLGLAVASAAPRSQYKFANGRVANGEDADITDFPFMASIQVFGGHYCGAGILDSTHVFTAAHCAEGINPSDIQIMVGSNSQTNPGTMYGLTDYMLHEDYGFPYNDVALLFIDGEIVDEGDNIDFVALAETDAEDFVGNDCEMVGWGATESGSLPDILQFAPANVISLEDCQQDWSFMEEQHICIRDPNGVQGICGGDSGSPLMCIDSSGARVHVGVTSGSDGACPSSFAQGYMRTSFYYQWVQDNM